MQGTGASRRLRNAQKVPGIVYGAGTPAMIELDHNALFFALKKEAFHSSLLDMELAGKTEQVLLRDYQMHPFRPIVMHIDFQRVDATTKVTKKVPLHYVNEENSPAVKTDACVVNHVVNELNIQCLASQLPEFITVDLGNLTKGQSLHVSDIAARPRHQGRHARQAEPGDRVGERAGRRGRGSRRRRRSSRTPRRRPDQGQEDREAEQEVSAPRRGMRSPATAGLFSARRLR